MKVPMRRSRRNLNLTPILNDVLPPAYLDTSPHTWITDLLVPSWISSHVESFTELLCGIKDYSKRDRIYLHIDLPQLVDGSSRISRFENPLASATTMAVE